MKKNKKIIISISAVIICVLAIVLITSMSRKTELTQLSDHGISQMMGYIIKTNNNKTANTAVLLHYTFFCKIYD